MNISSHERSTLLDYQYQLTQPYPSYAKKGKDGWKSVHQPLGVRMVQLHLEHKAIIATQGRYYPSYGILDIDDRSLAEVEQIRGHIGLNDTNSIIFTSESPNSYHIYFKPMRRGRLVTLNYYYQALSHALQSYQLEIYPQANRYIRLPLGKGQQMLKNGSSLSLAFAEGYARLKALAEFDLDGLPYFVMEERTFSYQHLMPSLTLPVQHQGWRQAGLTLLNQGLIASGTRLEATKRVIYFFWTQNIAIQNTIDATKVWIKTKHNQQSKDFSLNPRRVYQQIEELVHWIYDHFDKQHLLPASAHHLEHGYVSAKLVDFALDATQANLPLLRFYLKLLAYIAPRQVSGRYVAVHSDRLIEWSSRRSYLCYLRELQQQKLLIRNDDYVVGDHAKGILLLSDAPQPGDALMQLADPTRSALSLEDLLPQLYSVDAYAQKLKSYQLAKSTISKHLSLFYGDQCYQESKSNALAKAMLDLKTKDPQISHKELAKALAISTKTVQRLLAQSGQKLKNE